MIHLPQLLGDGMLTRILMNFSKILYTSGWDKVSIEDRLKIAPNITWTKVNTNLMMIKVKFAYSKRNAMIHISLDLYQHLQPISNLVIISGQSRFKSLFPYCAQQTESTSFLMLVLATRWAVVDLPLLSTLHLLPHTEPKSGKISKFNIVENWPLFKIWGQQKPGCKG